MNLLPPAVCSGELGGFGEEPGIQKDLWKHESKALSKEALRFFLLLLGQLQPAPGSLPSYLDATAGREGERQPGPGRTPRSAWKHRAISTGKCPGASLAPVPSWDPARGRELLPHPSRAAATSRQSCLALQWLSAGALRLGTHHPGEQEQSCAGLQQIGVRRSRKQGWEVVGILPGSVLTPCDTHGQNPAMPTQLWANICIASPGAGNKSRQQQRLGHLTGLCDLCSWQLPRCPPEWICTWLIFCKLLLWLLCKTQRLSKVFHCVLITSLH